MDPEWSDFKVLLALAGAGSVAGAARTLQVDNSTVSRRLAALEDSVGAKLIVRGGREFNWTAEGRILLAAAEAMDSAVVQAAREVRASKTNIEGSVRASVAPGFVPLMMRFLLPPLRQQHPGLRVELDANYHRADLIKGQADLAVRMARPNEPDLVARRTLDVGWYVFASKNYLATRGQPQRPQDLAQHQLVLYAQTMHHIAPLRWLEDYRGSTSHFMRVDNLEICCQTAVDDGGIVVLPNMIANREPQLQRVFPNAIGASTAWIVYHESLRDSARIRVVSDALAAFFENHASEFTG